MSALANLSGSLPVTTTLRYEANLVSPQASNGRNDERSTTISDFYLLRFHQDKIMNAAKRFGWPVEVIKRYSGDRGLHVLYAMLLLQVHDDRRTDTPLQICLSLAKDGKLSMSSSTALSPGLLFPIDLFDDKTEPTIGAFGALYQRSPIRIFVDEQIPALAVDLESCRCPNLNFENASPTVEKLLVNKYGEVLQGEFTTPYFQRDGAWVTPAFSGMLPDSVTRRYAIEHRLCREAIVLQLSLRHKEQCWLSDGVRGFIKGVIYLSTSASIQKTSSPRVGAESAALQTCTEQQIEADLTSMRPKPEKDELLESETRVAHPKRPNPFASMSSPATRRSKIGQRDFIPLAPADPDEVGPPASSRVLRSRRGLRKPSCENTAALR